MAVSNALRTSGRLKVRTLHTGRGVLGLDAGHVLQPSVRVGGCLVAAADDRLRGAA